MVHSFLQYDVQLFLWLLAPHEGSVLKLLTFLGFREVLSQEPHRKPTGRQRQSEIGPAAHYVIAVISRVAAEGFRVPGTGNNFPIPDHSQ